MALDRTCRGECTLACVVDLSNCERALSQVRCGPTSHPRRDTSVNPKVNKVVLATATLGFAGLALPSTVNAAPVDSVQPRVTSVGGINLVPTPKGLGLGGLTELTLANCGIGSGCAAREWQRLIGSDANDPDQVITVQSNVGILPTTRLAKRDMKAVKEQFQKFRANSGFVGSIKKSTSKGITYLKISGRFDQTVDDHVRIVQARQGTSTVLLAVNLDNRLTTGTLPSSASVKSLTKKVRTVYTKNWSQVPTTVLP